MGWRAPSSRLSAPSVQTHRHPLRPHAAGRAAGRRGMWGEGTKMAAGLGRPRGAPRPVCVSGWPTERGALFPRPGRPARGAPEAPARRGSAMGPGSAHYPAGALPALRWLPAAVDPEAAGPPGRRPGRARGCPLRTPPAAARRTGAAGVCAVVPPGEPGAAASAAPGPAPQPAPRVRCARGERRRGRGPPRLGRKGWGRGPRPPRTRP